MGFHIEMKPCLLFFALLLPLQSSAMPVADDLELLAQDIQNKAEEVVEVHNLVGLGIGIVHGDTVLLEHGLGVTQWQGDQQVDADTIFRIASLSKAFAATLAGMMVEERLISWEAPVINWLPTFTLRAPAVAEQLTIEDVLSHRTGLPRNALDLSLEGNEPYRALLEKLSQVRAVCSVGNCYGYQNIAYSLIGDISLAVTGRFYTVEIERRMFHPLQMNTATFGLESLQSSPSWARPHVRAGRGWRSVDVKPTYYRIAPAAGINASVRDMNRWMIAQLGHVPDVLPPSLLEELQRPRTQTDVELRRGPRWRRERLRQAEYALGWRVYDYAGERMIYHAGAVQGYRAMLALLPEHDLGMVILWNSESGAPGGLLPTLFDQFLGLPEVDWLELDKARTERDGGR